MKLPQGLYAIIDAEVHQSYGLLRLQNQIIFESKIKVLQWRFKKHINQRYQLLTELIKTPPSCPLYIICNEPLYTPPPIKNIFWGQHYGQEDQDILVKKNEILGVSARTIESVTLAFNNGADYVGAGAIFASTTKFHAPVIGIKKLKSLLHLGPIVAIGGLNKNNLPDVWKTGCKHFALISGLIESNKFMGQTILEEWQTWQNQTC